LPEIFVAIACASKEPIRRHVNPDTVDRDLDEVFHPRSHYY